MKYFSNFVSFFIKIGYNTEKRQSKHISIHRIMITFYFIQLIGYVFSEYETKTLKYQENAYLAKITEYSSLLFIVTLFQHDQITLMIFYSIIIIMCFVYALILVQLIYKVSIRYYQSFSNVNVINKFIRFYFQNLQWYIFTPFCELMIGIITCGRLAYLETYSTIHQQFCFTQLSIGYIIISLIGLILIIISVFFSAYCYRNYQFLSADLMRNFSHLNFITILLQISLKMVSFWLRDWGNYITIKHFLFIAIIFTIIIEIYQQMPFGCMTETIYFIQCLVSTIFYELLLIIWIFSNQDDSLLFFSFFTMLPLIFGSISAIFEKRFSQQREDFCAKGSGITFELQLESLCALGHTKILNQQDCFTILKCLAIHCRTCQDLKCPCNQRITKFTSFEFYINVVVLRLWILYQFQKNFKSSISKFHQISQFEKSTLKFVTFLQKYQENQVLSFYIIQDIILKFQQKNIGRVSQFFLSQTKEIQFQNKIDREQNNRLQILIQQSEFRILQDLNLYYIYDYQIINSLSELLQSIKLMWISTMYNQVSYYQLLNHSENIEMKKQKIKLLFNKFQSQREHPITDTILVLRIRLLIALICMQDMNIILQIVNKVIAFEREEHSLKNTIFNNYSFFNGQAISVLSKVSPLTLGQISQKITGQFCTFFGYSTQEQSLTSIQQLLPKELGLIHNGLIENFLQVGESARLYNISEQFILNNENLIEKVNICLSTIYPYQGEQYSFVLVGHLLKTMKYSSESLDYNKKGYILVNSQFSVFGLTKNIFERINYRSYYKNEETNIISCEQIYNHFTLQDIIPQIQQVLEEYYNVQLIRSKTELESNIICQRENGVLQVSKARISKSCVTSLETKVKETNEKMLSRLKKLKINPGAQENFKQYPIEFSITQKILTPIILDSLSNFVYFIVEIDFINEIKLTGSPSQAKAKSPTLSEILGNQKVQVMSAQSQIIFSNDEDEINDQIEYLAEPTNTGTKQSSEELAEQIEKISLYINTHVLPQTLKSITAQFVLQFVLFFLIIIIISTLFMHKRDIQSGCLQQITGDLNFLDAYSQTMSGSRHVIYYRDFYSIQSDKIIPINNYQLNISRYDKIYMAWQHIQKGSIRLIEMYDTYSKIAQQSEIELINIYFINMDLKSKITQPLESYATYYQIMHYLFYMSYQTFASTPQVYLSGKNDTYFTQIARSQVYYNFFDVIESVNTTLNDCKIYNLTINNFFDQVIVYYFLIIYFVLIFQLMGIIAGYLKLIKSIKHNVKLFKLCDTGDCTQAISQCEQYQSIVKYDQILLRSHYFKFIMNQPLTIIKNLKKQNNKVIDIVIKRKKIGKKNKHSSSSLQFACPIFILALASICQLLYVLSFQILYQNLKQNISPINNKALNAQSMRLNFIVSVHRFDLYLVKLYFQTYTSLNQTDNIHQFMSRNIQTDTLILNLLDINSSLIQDDIVSLQSINFADLLLDDQSSYTLTNYDQQIFLAGDICNLTGCNMEVELFFDRLHKKYIVPLFSEGIINFHSKILQLMKSSEALIQKQSTSLELATALENIFNDSDYLIYILWGIDVVQYQIYQFSQYFINISLSTLTTLTQNNEQHIGAIGAMLAIGIFCYQLWFIHFFYKKYQLSKAMITFIPLPILFQKNIVKHIAANWRKHKT